jgi:hypothetical protein
MRAFLACLLLLACSSKPPEKPLAPLRPCNAYDYGSPMLQDPCDDGRGRLDLRPTDWDAATPLFLDGGSLLHIGDK